MKKLLSVLLVALMAVTMFGCGAKDEKEEVLVIYSPNSDGLIDNVIPRFEEATGIKVDLQSMGTGDVVARIEAEQANPQCDVWWGGWNISQATNHPDWCIEYVSPYDKNFEPEYQNYKGIVSEYCLEGDSVFILNNDVFAELGLKVEDFKGYSDLLWPELKGYVAMGDAANSSSAWAQLQVMLNDMGDENGDEKAWAWVEEFVASLDGKILDSSSAIYKKTAAGEYAVGVSYEDPCVGLLESGATNLTLVYPEEGASFGPAGAGIINGAPNLENAKKFIDFLQSPEGQDAIAHSTARPVDVKVNNYTEFMTSFDKINRKNVDAQYAADHKAEWQARFTEIVKKYAAE